MLEAMDVPGEGLPPEEPLLIQRSDGVLHPAPIRATAFLGLVKAGELLDRGLDADLQAAHGLSLRAFEVLLHLAAFSAHGSLRMAALAAQAPLSQSRVSRLVGELATRGLVERQTASEDSRGVEVTITRAGLDKVREAQDTHFAGLEARFFSRLSWEEVVALAKITTKVLADRTDDPAPPASSPS